MALSSPLANSCSMHVAELPTQSLVEKIKVNSGVRTVGIIGGGVSGIVTARILIEEGVDCTLFECTDKLGGVWAENYVGFGIQVPSALYEFLDEPLPEGWDFCSGVMIGNYIEQYARKHGVTWVAELNTRVTEIQNGSGGGYVLALEVDGRKMTEEFDLVVVATGVYGKQDKFIPNWPGSSSFKGQIIHCSDFLDLDITEDKHVISA